MSLQFKFILLFVVLLLASLGINSIISFKVTEDAMVESAQNTMDQANQEVIHKIDLFHKKAQSDLLMAMEHPAFMEYFNLPETRAGNHYDTNGHITFTPTQQSLKNQLDGWILSLQKRFPIVETCLIDQTGQEHTRITFGKIAPPEEFSSEESDSPFFQPTMAAKAGEVHIQYPYLSPDAKQWVFSYTSPIILTDGTKAGLLHYEVPVALFQALIRPDTSNRTNENQTSRMFILDPTGLIVADSHQEIPLKQKNSVLATDSKPADPLTEYLPKTDSLNGTLRFQALLERMKQGETGSGWYEEADVRHHIAFRPLPTFGWSVGHIRPHHALLQGKTSLTGIRHLFALTAFITLLVTMVTVWFWVLRITRPLQNLTHSAQKIANGDLDFTMRVDEKSHDELGILARSFNQMMHTLSQTTDSKAFTEHVMSAMVDSLLVLDMENRIQRVNKALLDLLEEQEEQLLGRHLDQLLPDPAFCALMFRDLLANRIYRCQETSFHTRDGREVPVSISSNLLKNGESITGMVILAQDIRQRKHNEEQLHFLANFDVLTQLPNRSLLIERLSQKLTRAPWRKINVGLMHCALDRFKTINETLGHRAGDELLKETANRLRTCVREGDTVARISGDEFLILLMDMAKAEDIIQLAKKISHAVSLPLLLSNNQEVFVTASIGISLFPDNGSTPDELLKNANIATNYAKAQGKNQFYFFSVEMNQKGAQRLSMESDLRRAIERGELEAHFQPRWDLREDRLVGAEALVRWRRGGDKLIAPGAFLPLAEELGLIEAIDLWMLQEVCQQAKAWRTSGYPDLRLSLNLSHHLFGRRDLVAVIQQALEVVKLDPHALELELTEAIVMHDMTHAMNSLHALRDMSIHLAVDDFGTGYSSFSHLRRLPVHILKIDRSFVREINTNREDAAITHAIITMAHTLNLRTTAEGAEEQAQRDLLTSLGCDELQGYLISRPIPATEMEARFLAHLK
ncbi:MAG: EAL domain-containing protein [Magnetococcus sp. YQC-5]